MFSTFSKVWREVSEEERPKSRSTKTGTDPSITRSQYDTTSRLQRPLRKVTRFSETVDVKENSTVTERDSWPRLKRTYEDRSTPVKEPLKDRSSIHILKERPTREAKLDPNQKSGSSWNIFSGLSGLFGKDKELSDMKDYMNKMVPATSRNPSITRRRVVSDSTIRSIPLNTPKLNRFGLPERNITSNYSNEFKRRKVDIDTVIDLKISQRPKISTPESIFPTIRPTSRSIIEDIDKHIVEDPAKPSPFSFTKRVRLPSTVSNDYQSNINTSPQQGPPPPVKLPDTQTQLQTRQLKDEILLSKIKDLTKEVQELKSYSQTEIAKLQEEVKRLQEAQLQTQNHFSQKISTRTSNSKINSTTKNLITTPPRDTRKRTGILEELHLKEKNEQPESDEEFDVSLSPAKPNLSIYLSK